MIGRAGVGRRQRRRRGGDAPRDRRRERARVERRLGRRAHDRAAARARAQHPAGARGAEGGPLGALALRRRRAGGQDARRARLRPHRAAGRRAARSASGCASSPTTRSSRTSASASSASTRRESHEAVFAAADFLTLHLPLTRRDARARRRESLRADAARRRASSTPRAASWSTRTRCVEALRSGHVAGAASTSSPQEPYSGPLLELDERRRHAAPRGLDGGGAGPRGVIVAEQVAAALEGGLVTNAVNIPAVGAEDMEVLGPSIPLAATLGRLAMELAEAARVARSSSRYLRRAAEHDTRLLTVGRAERRLPGPRRPAGQLRERAVDRRRARDRGARRSERRASRDFTNLVRRRARTRWRSPARPSAASTGRGSCARSASSSRSSSRRAWSSSATPTSPGVIGRVGTLFGEAGVNIANMAVSRTRRGGKALMALSIDSEAPPELRRAVPRPGASTTCGS